MTAVSVISLIISVISLVAAAYIGVKQYVTQKNSNSVPAAFEILRLLQEPEFHDSFDFVVERLKEYDSERGLIGLPAEARRKVLFICYFIQHIAMLILLDLIDERTFTAYFRARTVAIWKAVEPFIANERALNPATGPEFLTLLEAFAIKADRTTPEVAEEILNKWLMKGTARWAIGPVNRRTTTPLRIRTGAFNQKRAPQVAGNLGGKEADCPAERLQSEEREGRAP